MKHIDVQHQNLHMQGFTTDGKYYYWSFTDSLVMTTMNGTVIRQVPVHFGHLGDIDYYDGRIYGALTDGMAGDWIYVYDADSLTLIKTIRLTECVNFKKERFNGFRLVGAVAVGPDAESGEASLMVICGLADAPEIDRQTILQYPLEGGTLQKIHEIPTGPLALGVQNIDRDPLTGDWWLAAYGPTKDFHRKENLYRISPDFSAILEAYIYPTAYGIHCLGNGRFHMSLQAGVNGHRSGYAYEVDIDFVKRVSENGFGEEGINKYITEMFDEQYGL